MKKPSNIRKEPRQKRSKALVGAILEAVARVLPEVELDEVTTNHIAKVAGVSIGSLYQYFPDKESIVAYFIERDLKMEEEEYRALFNRFEDKAAEGLIDAIVERASTRYLERPDSLRAILLTVIRLGHVKTVLELRNAVGKVLTDNLAKRSDILIEDPDLTAFVLVNAFMGVYQAQVLAESDDRVDSSALTKELKRMLKRYLLPQPQ